MILIADDLWREVRRQIGGNATLAASSQGEDRWRAAQEEATLESAV
jgi:hypothetical protein